MRIWNIMKRRGIAVFFTIFLVAVIALPVSLSCTGPIEIGSEAGFTIDAEECRPFTMQFTSSNITCPSPVIYYWIIGTLPPYANFDNITGTITGCPQVGDPSAEFTIGVTEFTEPDCGPNYDWELVKINVVPTASTCDMEILPLFYPIAWEGYAFGMDLEVFGGIGPFTWSTTPLPAGLALTDPDNGIIEGVLDPGTCGMYTVTATVIDNGTCCCPAANRDFILYVDCWANYPPEYYGPSGCEYSVQIGTGLMQGSTNVAIDGTSETYLSGGQAQTFSSSPCESHLVMVDQTVEAANTRFSVIGSNTKLVTDLDNSAFFDYAPELYIGTATSPSGIAEPTGAGYYAVGSFFSGLTPGNIDSSTLPGTRYVFREWQLPDGSKSAGVNLTFPVSIAGTAIAEYDTYYLLTLTSDYPPINETSWHKAGNTATWNLSLHAVPMESPLWAFLGGTISPVNPSGSQVMTGPSTVQIQWKPNYMGPLLALVIALLVIIGLIVLISRLRRPPVAKVTKARVEPPIKRVKKATVVKKTSSRRLTDEDEEEEEEEEEE